MHKKRLGLYKRIEDFTKSKVLSFVTGDRQNRQIQIAPDCIDYFVEHLDQIGDTKKISLILYTRGGHTLTGWSLVNLIRQFCDEFQVIVISKAHSTGTLICLGADKILMTKQATLGPIDPSTNGPLNPAHPGANPLTRIPVSVESINAYMQFAKGLKIESSEELTKILINLSNQIHPLVLGDVNRARNQIRMLGERLMANHINEEDKRKEILDFLCSESGSHDYTIHRKEAKDILGLRIDKPNDTEYGILKQLHDNISEELQLLNLYDPTIYLGQNEETTYKTVRGLIESVGSPSVKFVSEGILRRVKSQQGQQLVEDIKTADGWRIEE
ncbi:ATP-dependent Clp protease proteolytic subunit [bacterium]|nr:ATP-dependent Clp protease proteolytic subunit [bacterium]